MSREYAYTSCDTSFNKNMSDSSFHHPPNLNNETTTDQQVTGYPLASDVIYEPTQHHQTIFHPLVSTVDEDNNELLDLTEATNQVPLAQQPKKRVELLIEKKNKPSLTRMKMDELVKALRICPADEIKYENDRGINCKIVVDSFGYAHSLNVTVTYLSFPKMSLPQFPETSPDPNICDYHNIQGPTALEDYIFNHCQIPCSYSGKGRSGVWDRFSITRNGIHMGTFRDIRTQLVGDYAANAQSLQDALEITVTKRGPGPASKPYQALKGRFDNLEEAVANQRDAATRQRDAANATSKRLFNLFVEMHKTWTEEGQAFTNAQLLKFKSIAESAPQLWGDVLQEDGTDDADMADLA